MAGIQIIGSPTTVEVARVLACLFEKDLDFDLIRVDSFKGRQRQTDHLKQQPSTESLTYKEGKTVLVKSREIIRHIAKTHPTSGNRDLLGTGDIEKAWVEEWLQREENHFDPPASSLLFKLVYSPVQQKQGRRRQDGEEEISAKEKELDRVLGMYEAQLEKTRFLAGDQFSLADLSHLPTIDLLMETECAALFTAKPKVMEWWDSISTRPSWTRVVSMMQEEERPVHVN